MNTHTHAHIYIHTHGHGHGHTDRCVLHATILNSRAEAYLDVLEGDVISNMALHNPQLVKVRVEERRGKEWSGEERRG